MLSHGSNFSNKDITHAVLKLTTLFRMVKWYPLRDWLIGPFVAVATNSEIVDYILYADWFNQNHHRRLYIMRLVQSEPVIEIAPTRLGVLIRVNTQHRPKRTQIFFVRLYDTRVITKDLFRIETYQQTFRRWFKAVKRINKN